MGREIKFRAWNDRTKEMRGVMGFRINEDGSKTWNCTERYGNWEPLCDKFTKVIIMQFTGLKDKNGKEIYEGDIIEQTFYGDDVSKIILIVEDIIQLSEIRCGSSKENEVIGNIYENNPYYSSEGLLEDKK